MQLQRSPIPGAASTRLPGPRSSPRLVGGSRHPGVLGRGSRHAVQKQIGRRGRWSLEVGEVVGEVVEFGPRVDYSQLVVLAATAGAGAFWWYMVVPSERASLSKNKRRGELKTYIEELQEGEGRGLERWFYTDWIRAAQARTGSRAKALPPEAAGADPKGEGDPTPCPDEAGSAEFEGSNPGSAELEESNPTPRFASLDNPIVVTFLLVGVGGVVAAVAR